MAKNMFIGVSDKARKVTKVYVGVGNVARKVTKVYVGVGNVARLVWTSGVNYSGAITSLSVARGDLAAGSVGSYVLFGGGGPNGGYTSVVDAYNTSLTRSTPTALSQARSGLAAGSVGNYVLFGGGVAAGANVNSGTFSAVVDAYNASLTRSIPTALSFSYPGHAAGSVGNYVLFGGGITGSTGWSTFSAVVEAYNTSLIKSTPTTLSLARSHLAAGSVGNYVLFGGGQALSDSGGREYTSTVDAYNASLTRSTPTSLSFKRYNSAAGSVGNYVLFGGGNQSSIVNAYDTSLTRSIPTALSSGREWVKAGSVGSYVLFGGGAEGMSSATVSSIVDIYNTSLTSTLTALSEARYFLAAGSVGNYVLFGGGNSSSTVFSSVVDAYSG
jgi:hypothetical protein